MLATVAARRIAPRRPVHAAVMVSFVLMGPTVVAVGFKFVPPLQIVGGEGRSGQRVQGASPGRRHSPRMSGSSVGDPEGGEGPGRVADVVTQGGGEVDRSRLLGSPISGMAVG
jgi:hypothetical protein